MKGLWQATIYRPDDRVADTQEEAQEVLSRLGPGWVVDSAEDESMGIWLISGPPELDVILEKRGYYGRRIRGGWKLEIDTP